MNNYIYRLQTSATKAMLAVIIGTTAAYGQISEELTGDQASAEAPPVEEAEVGSAISGSLSFDFNTHFISYGLDVWGTGSKWDDILFNPSASIGVDFGDGFYGYAGAWLDINDNATSGIGDKIQELDLWIGGGYDIGNWNFDLAYQEWIYAGDSERILDLAISYDTFLSPSLMIHNRVDGNGGQKRGTVFVLGASHGFEYEDLSISLGGDVAFNTTDYYGLEGGFTYFAINLGLSYPLSFISQKYGEWDIHGGITYYYTNDKTVPNPSDSFVTGNVGIGMSF